MQLQALFNRLYGLQHIIYKLLSQKTHKYDTLSASLSDRRDGVRAISRIIDRFCQKHRGFGVPRLMLCIVLISAGVFIVGGIGLFAFFAFDPVMIMRGQVWRLITWVFLQFPLQYYAILSMQNVFFAAIALYFYHFIGSTLEREWGTAKFTIFYISGIILNIIYGLIIFSLGYAIIIYPTYLNLSMLFAFATLFPDVQIRLFFIIPIKVKWLALVNAAFFVYNIVAGIVDGQILLAFLPVVSVINYILICGDELMSYIRPMKIRTSPQIVNFKKAAKQAKRDLADKPYRHKCAVCGKTDTEYPDLEFRYCSRCNGYHCFCSDHIGNHIHFKQ